MGGRCFIACRECVGRPRAGGGLPDRRKFYCPLPACAEVLVCRRFADLRTRPRSGRNELGAGPEYAHNLLVAAWLRVLAAASGYLAWLPCRLRQASANTK